MPSSARLRQHFDENAEGLAVQLDARLLGLFDMSGINVTPLDNGWILLDMDIYPMVNSGKKRRW